MQVLLQEIVTVWDFYCRRLLLFAIVTAGDCNCMHEIVTVCNCYNMRLLLQEIVTAGELQWEEYWRVVQSLRMCLHPLGRSRRWFCLTEVEYDFPSSFDSFSKHVWPAGAGRDGAEHHQPRKKVKLIMSQPVFQLRMSQPIIVMLRMPIFQLRLKQPIIRFQLRLKQHICRYNQRQKRLKTALAWFVQNNIILSLVPILIFADWCKQLTIWRLESFCRKEVSESEFWAPF